ncbi:MAG: PP2C family protein-serine/threonine phosphatase [Desulfobacteraceae bacterium]|nr:PP2C family protein-serine/threonine phosphatase [Desulfobacteraceae bacterium]
MALDLKWLLKLPTGRLPRRVVLWVFVSVILIETIIFIPSLNNRKQELLSQIRDISTAKISVILQLSEEHYSSEDLLSHLQFLEKHPLILGGTLYSLSGSVLGSFGEPPTLSYENIVGNGVREALDEDGERYDVAWTAQELGKDLVLVLRHDTTNVRRGLMAFMLRIAGLVVIISLFVTAGAWIALEPIVINPILKLRRDLTAAGEAVRNDQDPPEFYAASEHREDELGDVISAFIQMYRKITEAIAERKRAEDSLQASLRQVEDYSTALDKELEQGRLMQANFLPEALPVKKGWRFAADFNPARTVSGDFYDVFDLPGGRIGLVLADVCDKGVGAALFMALIRSLIRVFSGQTNLDGLLLPREKADIGIDNPKSDSPELERYHNNALAAVGLTGSYIAHNHGQLGMFATVFFGVLCPASGLLTYINGGHEAPVILGKEGVKQRLHPTGPAVGLEESPAYRNGRVTLEPGDILFAYTDGVTEARSPEDRMFTRDRLYSLLEPPKEDAEALLTHVRRELLGFIGDAPQEDDITVLAVQRCVESGGENSER